MKSIAAVVVFRTASWTAPTRSPAKTCCISLFSRPVHCEMKEIPFRKCLNPGKFVMLRKRVSSSSAPAICVHHFTRWSLNIPLWSWWRMSGVKQVNISVYGRISQKGSYTGLIPSSLKALALQPDFLCSKITFVHSCSRIGESMSSPH